MVVSSIYPLVIAKKILLMIATALLVAGAARAEALHESALDIRVQIEGGTVIVNVEFVVQATPEEAWVVMTDFDNAARFIHKLQESRVLSRSAGILVVSQKGTMGLGPFSVPLESVSEIRLKPYEKIQSRMISGNMKKYDSDTTLLRDTEGTRVLYRVESIPEAWIPPIVGRAMIEFETRSRFRQLVEEILRRKAHPRPVGEGVHAPLSTVLGSGIISFERPDSTHSRGRYLFKNKELAVLFIECPVPA